MDGAFNCWRCDWRVDGALRRGLDNRTVMDLQRSASELLFTVITHFVGDGKLIDNEHCLAPTFASIDCFSPAVECVVCRSEQSKRQCPLLSSVSL